MVTATYHKPTKRQCTSVDLSTYKCAEQTTMQLFFFLFPKGRLPRIYTMIRNYIHPTLTKGQTACVTIVGAITRLKNAKGPVT